MNEPTELSFERVTYRDGQLLTARDLSADQARHTRLRQLHTRYLHDTWGIATGFDVQAAGPGAIAVGPGYALDESNRELLLAESIAIPVPAVVGPELLVLVMTFDPRDACACGPRGDAACFGNSLDPGHERPLFAWRTMDTLQIGNDVPLCSVTVLNGIIQGAVEKRVRRYARRFVRPHIETGLTDVDSSAWGGWWRDNLRMGLQRTVSTVEAGFTTVPLYFAQVVPTQPSAKHSPEQVADALAQSHGYIQSTSIDSFEYRLFVDEGFVGDLKTWSVSWIGIEPLGGCPPSLDFLRLISAAFLPIHLHV